VTNDKLSATSVETANILTYHSVLYHNAVFSVLHYGISCCWNSRWNSVDAQCLSHDNRWAVAGQFVTGAVCYCSSCHVFFGYELKQQVHQLHLKTTFWDQQNKLIVIPVLDFSRLQSWSRYLFSKSWTFESWFDQDIRV